jgi:divalent metal cation (Fe/Co/Zn/Cd) transporter
MAISASLAIGLGLMALKFFAFWLAGSAAILSDAPLGYL